MKAVVTIENLKSTDSKNRIVRNLSRILNLRVLDIDLEHQTIHLVYDSILAFENARRELLSIGFPITRCTYQEPRRSGIRTITEFETTDHEVIQ